MGSYILNHNMHVFANTLGLSGQIVTIVECRRIISNRYPKYTKTGADFYATCLLGICDKAKCRSAENLQGPEEATSL